MSLAQALDEGSVFFGDRDTRDQGSLPFMPNSTRRGAVTRVMIDEDETGCGGDASEHLGHAGAQRAGAVDEGDLRQEESSNAVQPKISSHAGPLVGADALFPLATIIEQIVARSTRQDLRELQSLA